MLMTNEEVKDAVRVWPANVKAPLDRDTQIALMKGARDRHLEHRKRILGLLKENKNVLD